MTSITRELRGLSPEQRELLDLLIEEGADPEEDLLIAPCAREPEGSPLSFGQQRLWFQEQLAPDSSAYNQLGLFHLEGPLRIRRLEQALDELRRRHEILRTTFADREGVPVQIVAPSLRLDLRLVDLGALPAAAHEARIEHLAAGEVRRRFALSSGPLLRALLVRQDDRRHALILTAHHIVCDGWSVPILTRELAAIYDALAAGGPSPLPPLPIQYVDFASWQRRRLQGRALDEPLEYWRRRLGGSRAALDLPTDRPRRGSGFVASSRSFALPRELHGALQEIGRREEVTLFMLLLAAFQTLLHRWTGQDDISVSTPVAGRGHASIEPLIGFFVNNLILRTDLSGDPSFRLLLDRVREVCLGAYAHQELPFERLVEDLQPERDSGRPPLAQVSFMLHKALVEPRTLSGNLRLSLERMELGAGEMDLNLIVWEGAAGLTGSVVYNAALFDASTIDRMLGHFRVLLEGLIADADRALSAMPLLTAPERERLLPGRVDATASDETGEGWVHVQFAAQAMLAPEAAAIVCGATLSYGELNRRANRLASRLRAQGVGPDVRVAVCMERSAEMVVAMLGILKAGGAYVPLDPHDGRDRLEFVLGDAAAPIVLTQRSLIDTLPDGAAERMALDAVEDPAGPDRPWPPASDDLPGSGVSGDNLAYVIYTSGSTGRPKGVEVRHAALRNLVAWHRRTYAVSAVDRATQVAGAGFDASVWELWPYLASGASVTIVPDELRGSPAKLLDFLAQAAITLCFLPTPLAESVLLERPPHGLRLRGLLTGGDRLRRRPRPGSPFPVFNHYGPTEATVVTTWGEVEAASAGAALPSIGRPISNVRAYVLDAAMNLVPEGVAGELHVAGAALARGYLNRPEETAERFLPDPFGAAHGSRLYRTGDKVRRLPDGRLEFLGRLDDQVKVRGLRVEPGEIEAALARHPALKQAVVVAREGAGGTRLVGCVVPGATPTPEGGWPAELRRFLKGKLPDLMIPTAWVVVDALPLTRHGKVDRAALPAPKETGLERAYLAPRTATEKELARLWSELLGAERPGLHDDFFDLGGHSLLATQLVSRLRESFGVELPLRSLFDAPALGELAGAIETARIGGAGPPVPAIRPVPRGDGLRLSFAQERLWFLDQLSPEETSYNMPAAIRLNGPLDIGALQESFREILRRHEILRTTFPARAGRPVQSIRNDAGLSMPVIDLGGLPDAGREAAIARLAGREAGHRFDLARGPLVRCRLLRLDTTRHVLLVTLHHIVFDGWSLGIFIRELGALYGAFAGGRGSPLAGSAIQYADFAAWQREWLTGEELERQLGYWKRQLAEVPILELPADRPRGAVTARRGRSQSLRLGRELSADLRRLSRDADATLFMTLLAAFKVLLSRYSGQEDVVVGTPISGRNRSELEPLIGFFVNTLALRTDLSGDPTFRELVGRVKGVALEAFAHQDLPFEKLVEELRPDRDLVASPLFQVFFNMIGFQGGRFDLPGLETELLESPDPGSKFELALHAVDQGDDIELRLVCDAHLFDRATSERMLEHLTTLLSGIAADSERALSECPLLSAPERARLASAVNRVRPDVAFTPFDRSEVAQSIPARFARQARNNPRQVALRAGTDAWSYEDLDGVSNRVARSILAQRPDPGGRVALLFEPGAPLLVAGILGALKAGKCYVPLDPDHPVAWNRSLLQDAQVSALVTDRGNLEPARELSRGPEADRPALIAIDAMPVAGDPIEVPVSPEHLAYILYTSGTTGLPKGVMQSHRNVLHHIRNYTNALHLRSEDRLSLLSSYTFDAAIMDIFGALLNGATLCLRSLKKDGIAGLPEWLRAERITVYHSTPTVFRHLCGMLGADESIQGVRLVVLGGEAVVRRDVDLCRAHFPRECLFVNGLGPTESTLALQYFVDRGSELPRHDVPVGYAVEDAEVLLLDGAGKPAELYGEIAIRSPGVALGYWNRPGLTSRSFPTDAVRRLYRTGDMGRRLSDGVIAFAGRRDLQLKIRGHRVEPEEIESALLELGTLRQAVVSARECSGETRLVAHVVPSAPPTPSPRSLREALRRRLPEFMVPSWFVLLDALPVTPHGKIDRKALPAPAESGLERDHVAPRSDEEAELARFWAELLGVTRVGIHDDFFEMGGHSLLATQLAARVRDTWGVEIPLRRLFEAPTIAGLTDTIAAARRSAAGTPVAEPPRRAPGRDAARPSFVQERMWVSERLAPGSGAMNGGGAVDLHGALDAPAMERSFAAIVRRHDVLKTVFPSIDGRPVAAIRPDEWPGLAITDLAGLPGDGARARALELADQEVSRPFDLERGPLLRARLFRLGEREHLLVVAAHHIAFDGWSSGVLARELVVHYEAMVAGREPVLSALPIQYADHAAWQRDRFRGERLERQLEHWRRHLRGVLPVLRLPTDRPRSHVSSLRGASLPLSIAPELTGALQAAGRRESATLFMTLLAAFKAWLHAWTGQEDLVVGSPVAGRTRSETTDLIGCFMQPLILRTDLSGNPTFNELLARVREVCLGAYAHQEVPFELVVQDLQPQWKPGQAPIFQTLFNLTPAPRPDLTLPELRVTPVDLSDHRVAGLDLAVNLRAEDGGLRGTIDYSAELFDRGTIERMRESFLQLLDRVASDPACRLRHLPAPALSIAAGLANRERPPEQSPGRSQLSPDQQELLDLTMQEEGWPVGEPLLRPRPGGEARLPLTFGQEGLWFLDQFEPGSPAFNEPGAFRLTGPLRIAALRRALNEIVGRHEALRTSFRNVAGRPEQVIAPALRLRLPLSDLSGLPAAAREMECRRRIDEEAGRPFDLARGPLIRARLLRLEETDHLLLVTVHHGVFDGGSVRVFLCELQSSYGALAAGRDPSLPSLPIQYPDYALWQRRRLEGDRLDSQIAVWKRRLQAPRAVLELPLDRPRPASLSSRRGRLLHFALPAELHAALKELSRSAGVTLFMTLLAAFKTLLLRYSGQEDVLVDTPIAGRDRPELDGLIGFFVNTLVLRTDLSGDPGFRELLGRVREICLEAYANQEVPFERLVREVVADRDMSRQPLAQVAFMLHRDLVEPMELAPGLMLRPESIGFADEMDLALFLWEGRQGLTGTLRYNPDLFEASTIDRMSGHLTTLLHGIVADPDRKLSMLPLLTAAERRREVEWGAATAVPRSSACLHERFEAQVLRTPASLALVESPAPEGAEDGTPGITYAELNDRANRLAHYLIERGVGPEVRVGIGMRRTPEMVVALLGVLKAGGAYLPLDPDSPAERLTFMLRDGEARLLLTQAGALQGGSDFGVPVVSVDSEQAAIARRSASNPGRCVRPENLAYLIFTSGSTGRPKGVMATHAGVVNHNLAVAGGFGLRPDDRVLQFHPVSFDAAVEEIFPTLACGATLVLAPDRPPAPDAELEQLIEARQVTVLDLPTAYWSEWALTREGQGERRGAALPRSLRLLVLGGDRIPPERFARWRAGAGRGLRVLNSYGPTEASVVATLHEPAPAGPGEPDAIEIPIGRPIDNMRAYLLDRHLEPMPVGIPGELYLGGPGVARGYLARPDWTAERFLPDPLTPGGGRLYRTGDVAKRLPDGSLQFVGRADDQIKLRGFRIEPGEIASVLQEHPSVLRAVVAAGRGSPGGVRLTAYIVADPGDASTIGTPTVLRRYLKEKLPDYMLPSAFVWLDRLPLTPAGKVDRQALPEPGAERPDLAQGYTAPATPEEEMLAAIWSQALAVERVGRHDNFFELGGHSLLAAQVIFRVRERFGVDLPVRALFEGPTVAGMARAIAERGSGAGRIEAGGAEAGGIGEEGDEPPAVRALPRSGEIPLSFPQEGLWFLDQLQPGVPFNIPLQVRLRGRLDAESLQRAVDEIVRRHEALRTCFAKIDGRPVQRIVPEAPVPMRLVDLSGLGDEERVDQARALAVEAARAGLNLACAPLLRLNVMRLGPEDHVVLLVLHHIVFDGGSIGVFASELAALYGAFASKLPSPLPPPRIQYPDFAIWQQRWLRGERLERQLAYWKGQLSGRPPRLALGTRRAPIGMDGLQGATRALLLPRELGAALESLSRRSGATLFMTLLTAFKMLLCRYTGQSDITIGTPVAGRTRPEMEDLIGFCVNLLPLRTRLEGDPTFLEALERVRQVCMAAYRHQEVPFGVMVKALRPERGLHRTPLFQATFMLQNTPPGGALRLPGLQSASLFEAGDVRAWARSLEAGTAPAVDDLSLHVAPVGPGLLAVLHYRAALFEAETADRLLRHLQELLKGIVAGPDRRLWSLPMVTEGERRQLLVDWNATEAPRPRERTVHQLFEAQAERTPEGTALMVDGAALSYRELNLRANRLAWRLRDLGVGPESRVGLCVERSAEMAVGMLGILKAGGCYVPLDPASPAARLRHILRDAGIRILLSQHRVMEQLPATAGVEVVSLDGDCDPFQEPRTAAPASGVTAEHAAYVVYTSGSTGGPKGVIVPHGAVVNHNAAVARRFGLGAGDRVLQFHSISFDAAVEEIFPSWMSGSSVLMRSEGMAVPGTAWHRSLEREGVTVLNLPTAYWHEWMHELSRTGERLPRCLRLVVVGGEEPAAERLRTWREAGGDGVRWINTYGPTEATVIAALHEPDEKAGGVDRDDRIPIGRPIANTALYILDDGLNPLPVGVAGELYIGGAGVARGYLGCPELTAERFLPDPFRGVSGGRMVRTGDLARFRSDGNIEFLGRADRQVKVRGFRVEPGEIESALLRHPSVREAAVVAREDPIGGRRLVACVSGALPSSIDPAELQVFLRGSLPEPMRPHRFVVLDALPRTAGGKIDYQALPAAGVLREAEGRVAARDATESELARIWEEILDVRPIGVTDNFFALGGDSLLAVRLVSAVHHRLGRELPLAVLLQEGTVASMAEAVRRDDAAAFASPLVGFRTSGSRPPIFLPHALDGSVLCYAELARHLGPEQPVYGLQHPGLYDGAEPHGIEALASRYIEALLPVQPRGPYLLGGWSLGGVIAFEIARQLEARGEPVALLALLDAWVSPAGFRTLPQDEVGPLLDHLLPDARGPGLDDVRPGRTRQVIRNNVGALQRYAPGPYAGRIVLLRTAGVSPRGDATLGWGALAGSGVRVRALPGDHDTMLRPPHVRVLAEELNAAIERATRRPASPSPSDQAVVLQVVHVDALVEQDRLGEE